MSMTNTFRTWRRYRNTVNELGRMTNRELADIGIDRTEIRAVARRSR
jgi:uncharacterized protein YjiS (DUF1127 family)